MITLGVRCVVVPPHPSGATPPRRTTDGAASAPPPWPLLGACCAAPPRGPPGLASACPWCVPRQAAPPTPARGGCLSALPSASAHRPPVMGGSRKRQPPPSGRVAPASLAAVSGHLRYAGQVWPPRRRCLAAWPHSGQARPPPSGLRLLRRGSQPPRLALRLSRPGPARLSGPASAPRCRPAAPACGPWPGRSPQP